MLPRRLLPNPIIRKRWYTPFGSHVDDNDPLVIAREKERLLRGKKENQVFEYYNSYFITLKFIPFHVRKSQTYLKICTGLASDSEAMIKAEREPGPSSIKDLQNESVKALSNSDDDIEIIEHIKQEVKIKTEEEIITKARE